MWNHHATAMKLSMILIFWVVSSLKAKAENLMLSNPAIVFTTLVYQQNFQKTAASKCKPCIKRSLLKNRILTKIMKHQLQKKLSRTEGKKGNPTGLLALILGVGAFILMFTGISALIITSIAAAIAAIVLGIISLRKNEKKNWKGITGIILGVLALFLLAFLVILAASVISSIFGGLLS